MENNGFKSLAERIKNLEVGEVVEWTLNDGNANIIMGTKMIHEFSSNIALTAAYGGGFESAIWVDKYITVEDILERLNKYYEGSTFDSFIE